MAPVTIRRSWWAFGDGENFLGSDVAAFVAYTKRAMEIDQDQAVMVSADKVVVSDFMGNIVEHPKTYTVDWDASAAEKGGWDSFMDKEIHEDPAAVQRTLLGRLDENGNINLDEVRIDEHDFKAIDKIIVIACGTAAYAGMVAKYAIEHWVRIPVEVELAHEFRYRDPDPHPPNVGGGHLPVRRDHGHADGVASRP